MRIKVFLFRVWAIVPVSYQIPSILIIVKIFLFHIKHKGHNWNSHEVKKHSHLTIWTLISVTIIFKNSFKQDPHLVVVKSRDVYLPAVKMFCLCMVPKKCEILSPLSQLEKLSIQLIFHGVISSGFQQCQERNQKKKKKWTEFMLLKWMWTVYTGFI